MDNLLFIPRSSIDESIFIKNDFNDSYSLQWLSFVLQDTFNLIIFDPGVAEYFYCDKVRLEHFHTIVTGIGKMIIPTPYAIRFSDAELQAKNVLLSRKSFTLSNYISYVEQWENENNIDFFNSQRKYNPHQYLPIYAETCEPFSSHREKGWVCNSIRLTEYSKKIFIGKLIR